MVEHRLPKPGVAGSIPVSRSINSPGNLNQTVSEETRYSGLYLKRKTDVSPGAAMKTFTPVSIAAPALSWLSLFLRQQKMR